MEHFVQIVIRIESRVIRRAVLLDGLHDGVPLPGSLVHVVDPDIDKRRCDWLVRGRMTGQESQFVRHLLALQPPRTAHRILLDDLRGHICRCVQFFEPFPYGFIDLGGLQLRAVLLGGGQDLIRLRHVGAVHLRDIQDSKFPAARIAVGCFLRHALGFPACTRTFPAPAACVIRFCRHSSHRLSV